MAQWLLLANLLLWPSNALPVTVPSYVDVNKFRTDGKDNRFFSRCRDEVRQDCQEPVKGCGELRSSGPLSCAYSSNDYQDGLIMKKDEKYPCGKCVNQAETNRSWTLFCGYDAQSWVGLVHYQGQDCQELLQVDGLDFSLIPSTRRDGESVLACYRPTMYPCQSTCWTPRSYWPVGSQAECECDVCTFRPKPNHTTSGIVWYNIFEEKQHDIQV